MYRLLVPAALTAALFAQSTTTPVVNPRGVVNEFTRMPAPTMVAAGGVLRIEGINLGPAETLRATETPLPTSLGDPPVQVLINNRPAPLFSVSPTAIVCQVPFEVQDGLAQLVVRRGEVNSRPARFQVARAVPAWKTEGGQGFGMAANTGTAGQAELSASGLGQTEPRVATGEAAPPEGALTPVRDTRVYVNGLQAQASVQLSKKNVGEYEVRFPAPAGAREGEMVQLISGGAFSEPALLGRKSGSTLSYLAAPEGADLRNVASSDLRSTFAAANGVRDSEGCYASWVFDFSREMVRKLDGCLTSAQRAAPGPFILANNSPVLTAFVGPAEGQAPQGVSSKIQVLNPASDTPVTAELPAAASNVVTIANGDLAAVIPGTPARMVRIDPATGETEEMTAPANPANPAPQNPGGQQGLNLNNLRIDLGDDLTRVLSAPAALPNNQFALVVGDDLTAPKKAKIAVVNARLEVQSTRDYPAGWLPLLAPTTPTRPGQPPPPQPALPIRTAVPLLFDGGLRALISVGRGADGEKQAMITWPVETGDAAIIETPEGWYFTNCTLNPAVFNLELSRRLALYGSRTSQNEFRAQCPADGYLVFDFATRRLAAAPVTGSGQINAAGAAGDVNDFLFAPNLDPAQLTAPPDTLYVFDSVSASSYRFDLPTDVAGFTGAFAVRDMNLLVAMGRNRVPGDAGFVLFDFEKAEVRTLNTPNGFDTVNFVTIFPSTRKLVARGNRSGNSGSAYLVYDLVTGDVAMPANPEGVAFVGALPAATPGQPGQPPGVPGTPGQGGGQQAQTGTLQRINAKNNSITAIGFNAERRPVGVVLLQVN